jgi:hypothetical protein
MSKKKVLDYDPKTGFGKFAEIMNANNAIDMAQNKVNAGMAPVTAPVANPAAPKTGVPSLSGGSVVDLGGDETADHGIEGGATVSEQIPTVSGGETESGAVSGGATDTGNSTGIGTNVGSGVGTGTSVSAAAGVTANPITTIPSYKGDFGSYENWMAQNGYDPDTDYNNAKAALEYDYETSMATYGRRAEELYQMGLSNSGVSDIYQLGAFNAYLAAQNDLAYQNIEAKKKYRQEYNTLYDANQKAMQADTANAYNFALEQFDYEMDSDGNFTTNNAENIRAQLLSQGYDKTVVDNVMNMLNALDPATLPTEKAQAEERKKAQEEANAKAELKSMLTTIAFNAYDGNNIGEVETLLAQQPGVDSQMIADIVADITAREDISGSTAYKKKLEADVNEVNKLVAELGDSYDSSQEAAIRNLYSDWANIKIDNTGKTKLDLLIEKLNGYNTVAKPSEEEMAVAGMNAVKQIMGDEWSYDGTATAKNDIAKAVAGTDYKDYVKQITAQFEANRQSDANALVTDAVGKAVGEATIDELESAWSNAKDVYADDANSLNTNNDKISKKTKDLIEWALEGKDGEPVRLGSAEVAKALGFDASEWENLNDSEREREVLNLAGELKVSGQLTSLAYNMILSDYVTSETKLIIDEDQNNAQATGLQKAGELVYNLKEMKDSGYMTDEEYLARTREVINNMRFKQTGANSQITWNSKVEGAEATVVAIPYIDGFVKAKDASDAVDAYKNGAKTMHTWDYGYDLFAYNGKLYAYADGYLHGEVEPKNIFVQGDGVTNSDKQQAGVYEILVAMLTPR